MGRYVSNSAGSSKGGYVLPVGEPPVIEISSSALSFLDTPQGTYSSSQNYSVSGSNLTSNITITAPTGFIINQDNSNTNESPITLTQMGGIVGDTVIYVKFLPTSLTSYSGNITNTSTGASTKNVAITGTGIVSTLISTWYNSLSVAPSSALLTDLNILAEGLNTDGNWTKLDLFHPIGGLETNEQRLRPLISTSGNDFTTVNSPTLNANGVTGNGSTSYMNLQWIPSTNGVNFTLDSACKCIWNRTTGTSAGAWMGITTAANGTSRVYGKYTDNKAYFKINDTAAESSVTNTNPVGLLSVVRTSAASTDLYMSGTSLGTFARASVAVPNLTFFVCCHNSTGVPSEFTNRNFAAFAIGSGTINQANLNTRLATYMTARGI